MTLRLDPDVLDWFKAQRRDYQARINAALRAFYQRLLTAGKAKTLALAAAMRKLLVILNAMVRDGTTWNPDHAAAINL